MRSGTRRVFSHEGRVPVVHIDSDVNEVVSDVDDAELTDNGSVDDKFIDNTVASGDEHEQTDEDSGEQDEVHSDLPDRQPSRLPSKKVANITSSKAQGYGISSLQMSVFCLYYAYRKRRMFTNISDDTMWVPFSIFICIKRF